MSTQQQQEPYRPRPPHDRPRSLSIQSLISSPTRQLSPEPSPAPHGTKRQLDTEDDDRDDAEAEYMQRSIDEEEDMNVRLAAEALGDLRTDGQGKLAGGYSGAQSGFTSPGLTGTTTPINSYPTTHHAPSVPQSPPQAHTHPNSGLLGRLSNRYAVPVAGALATAYTSGKSYSPRFRYGAELVERRVGGPVGSLLNVVGVTAPGRRRGGARGEQAGDGHKTPKKRRTSAEYNAKTALAGIDEKLAALQSAEEGRESENIEMTPHQPHQPHQQSSTALARLPPDETLQLSHTNAQQRSANRPWQQRLMLSTSSLTVALSDESSKSLKSALLWLRWANTHLQKVVLALRSLLDQYEASLARNSSGEGEEERRVLGERMERAKEEIVGTIRRAVEVVGTYAGGALPEQARVTVRRHMFSLPRKFQRALGRTPPTRQNSVDPTIQTETAAPAQSVPGTPTLPPQAMTTAPAEESTPLSSATRILILAREGLETIKSVSDTIEETLIKAEGWAEFLGRKREGEGKDEEMGEGREREEEEEEVGRTERPVGRVEWRESEVGAGGREGMVLR